MTSDCDNAFCSQMFSIPTGTKENEKPCKNQGFPTEKSIGVTGFEYLFQVLSNIFMRLYPPGSPVRKPIR